ncbi:hypothetical protein AVEN_163049-1 [Araneus ventricosus]|uniref:Uncharacterized protein n=1 Tax=Araneus ventricosus TaxID=182803 RepID=A0A4Y2J6V0_ARAVE|nr:hypothetical protein AVEN_163049-1 [Araneus ventricosus]
MALYSSNLAPPWLHEPDATFLACRQSEVVGIETHQSMLLVYSPPDSVLCVLLPKNSIVAANAPPASTSVVKLITTNLSLSTKSLVEVKAEARKHGFAAYDCKIQTRKKPVVPIFKATEREEITRFCRSRSRFA